MNTMFLPAIRHEQYQSFRRVLNREIPETYEEWKHLSSLKVADSEGKGHKVREVEISPEEFTRFLNRRGEKATLQMLDHLAFEKGSKEQGGGRDRTW
jgi:hypothetical protein